MPIDILITVTCDYCGHGSAFKAPDISDGLNYRLEQLKDDLSMFVHGDRLFCSQRCRQRWIRNHTKGTPHG
jgi:hypothetical protein